MAAQISHSVDSLRRRLLVAAGVAFSPAAFSTREADPRFAFVDDLLQKDPAAVHLGQSYLASHPEEASYDVLWGHLFAEQVPWSWKECLGTFSQRVTEDFRRLDVIVIDGWVVSRSEARICALQSLGAVSGS